MYRAFKFTTEAGAYWSVVDAGTYETVTVADRFLQYVRFGPVSGNQRRKDCLLTT